VHLVGFIIRIYHAERSPEREIQPNSTHKCHTSKQTKCVSHTKINSLTLFIEVRKNYLLSASQDIHTLRGHNGEMLMSNMVEKLLIFGPK